MIIATAGHVDHGKTLLVKTLTGIDTDSLAEEKARGLTIDLGFAYTTDAFGSRLGFVDVPGHIRFINNMLAGVSAIDYALLVVAADDGPMPQTREHLAILDLLGVERGCIALTKTDRVSDERLAAATAEVRDMVAGTHFAAADVLPVSSITGEGIEELQLTLAAAAEDQGARSRNGFFRLAVDRAFSVRGSGLVVTGSVSAGSVSEGDEVYLYPLAEAARVRGLRRQDEVAETASVGDRCALNLSGRNIDASVVRRGFWVSANEQFNASERCDVFITVPKDSPGLRQRATCHVHFAANHVTARAAILNGNSLGPGESGLVQLKLDEPLYLCVDDRLILRDAAATTTIAGGRVIEPFSPARGRAKPERLTALAQLATAHDAADALAYVGIHPHGLDIAAAASALNQPITEAHGQLLGGTIMAPAALAQLQEQLLEKFKAWHEAHPFDSGLAPSAAQRLLPTAAVTLPHIIEQLVIDGRVTRSGNQLALPGYQVTLTPETQKIWDRAEPEIERAGIRPPVLHDLAKTLNLPPRNLTRALQECVGQRLLVKPAENRYFLPAAISELKQLLVKANDGQAFTVKQYRDVSGIGRNLTIEILEYFDRTRITRRRGDLRDIIDQE